MANIEDKYKEALNKASKTIIKLDKEIKSLKMQDPIAIIGMSCRFPAGANSPEKFWELLLSGKSTLSKIPKERFDIDLFYDQDKDKKVVYIQNMVIFRLSFDQFDTSF